MKREIYLDGKRFESIVSAMAYHYKRWGRRVSYKKLCTAADRDGMIAAGKRKEVRVSWKKEEAREVREEAREVREEAHTRVTPGRKPLLRYPGGEGPGYDWSRRWR